MPTVIRSTVQKDGFTNVRELAISLVSQLTTKGFNQVFPVGAYNGVSSVILQPNSDIDPLYDPTASAANSQSWRLAITVDGESIHINVATSLQLLDDGTIAKATWASEPATPGEILNFVDRRDFVGVTGSVYPMSYLFSISDHGVFIAVWDQGFDEYQNDKKNASPAFRWLLVQRPVDHLTGDTVLTGQAPVYCVYTVLEEGFIPLMAYESPPSASGGTTSTVDNPIVNDQTFKKVIVQFHRKFTVREIDIFRPSLTRPADSDREDSSAILNSNYQVSINEDNRYVITIPKGLNTTRYAYDHELDMIAFTSADVLSQWSELDLEVYNDSYKYKALIANRLKNTGMRILCRVTD